MTQPLLPLLPVEPDFFVWRGHRLAHYQAGQGHPVLLIHSINAAASAFEMRGPFMGLRDQFQVHTFDLLGYGNSDRPARRYQAEDYIDQIGTMLAQLPAPATLVASSLSCAYAAMAALRWPERVRALVLAVPTGMGQLSDAPGPVAQAIYARLRGPVGRAVFDQLTSRKGTAFFLRSQAYHDPAMIDEATHDGFYQTCRRPGAHYAPICFLTGLLNCDLRGSFERIRQPILLIWGRQSTTTEVRRADAFLVAQPRARLEVIDQASMLVQDEQPVQFNAAVRAFLG
ncbi:MAG: alpha/beta fold hydrolase [Oscillochloridaceae bacterium umkhey_bin13]